MTAGRRNFLLRGLVSVVFIALVARKLEWSGLGAVLRQLDWQLAAIGSLLSLLVVAGLAMRWRIFLRQQGINLSAPGILALTWGGQFFNSVLPGSTGGDVVKIYQLCRLEPQRKAAAAATVFADRLTALVALLLMAAVAFLMEPAPLTYLARQGLSVNVIVLWGMALALIGIAVAAWAFGRLRTTVLYGRITRTLAMALGSLKPNASLLLALALAFAVHLMSFGSVYFFARALQIGVSYGDILLMMPVVLFLLMVPVTINGHGLRELLLIGYFAYFGIGLEGGGESGLREIVVALSVVAAANDLFWSIPGAIWYFFRFGSSRPSVG